MTVDLDSTLRRHFAPAHEAELPAGSWERLEVRLDAALPDGAGGGGTGGRARRRLLAVAAVVAVAAGLAAATLAVQDDKEAERLDTTDVSAPSTVPGPGPASTTPTPEETPPAVERPTSVAVLIDDDGDGFSEVAVLDADGNRTTIVPEAGNALAGVVHVDVAPDGVVFFEICCEPAVGTVRAFDPATGNFWGEGTFDRPALDPGGPIIAHGHFPEVSPDGSELVVSVPSGSLEARGSFRIIDLATGEWRDVLDRGGEETEVNGISWSPDGTHLAVERLRYGAGGIEEVAIDLVSLYDGTSTPVPLPQGGAAMPSFLADGRLAVALGGRDADGEARSATVAILDPASPSGTPAGGLPFARGVSPTTALDVSADGTWIVTANRYGSILTFSTASGLRQEGTWPEDPWPENTDPRVDLQVVAAAW